MNPDRSCSGPTLRDDPRSYKTRPFQHILALDREESKVRTVAVPVGITSSTTAGDTSMPVHMKKEKNPR